MRACEPCTRPLSSAVQEGGTRDCCPSMRSRAHGISLDRHSPQEIAVRWARGNGTSRYPADSAARSRPGRSTFTGSNNWKLCAAVPDACFGARVKLCFRTTHSRSGRAGISHKLRHIRTMWRPPDRHPGRQIWSGSCVSAFRLKGGARAVLLTPRGHNPTGASWTRDRRSELADVLASFPRRDDP